MAYSDQVLFQSQMTGYRTTLAQGLAVRIVGTVLFSLLLLMAELPIELCLQLIVAWVGVVLSYHCLKVSLRTSTRLGQVYLGGLVLIALIATIWGVSLGRLRNQDNLEYLETWISREISTKPFAQPHPSQCTGCPSAWQDPKHGLLMTSAINGNVRFTATFREFISKTVEDPRIISSFWALAIIYFVATLFTGLTSGLAMLSELIEKYKAADSKKE